CFARHVAQAPEGVAQRVVLARVAVRGDARVAGDRVGLGGHVRACCGNGGSDSVDTDKVGAHVDCSSSSSVVCSSYYTHILHIRNPALHCACSRTAATTPQQGHTMNKHSSGSLMRTTRSMLQKTTLSHAQISRTTGLTPSGLSRFAAGALHGASADKVETLYNYLSGKKLEV